MNHVEKSLDLYGVDLALYLKKEVKFINQRIHLLTENLKVVTHKEADFNRCYRVKKAIAFWEDELKILRKRL